MKTRRRLLMAGLIISMLILFWTVKTRLGKEEESRSLNRLNQGVQSILEIATIEYKYTNLADYTNSLEFSGLTIPFTSKSFLVKYDGRIRAGFKDLDIRMVDEDRVVLKLGQALILENDIEEDQIFFYNEKDSAFNRLKFDELYQVLNQEKIKAEEDAINQGILKEADKNARLALESFLGNLGFEQVVFE